MVWSPQYLWGGGCCLGDGVFWLFISGVLYQAFRIPKLREIQPCLLWEVWVGGSLLSVFVRHENNTAPLIVVATWGKEPCGKVNIFAAEYLSNKSNPSDRNFVLYAKIVVEFLANWLIHYYAVSHVLHCNTHYALNDYSDKYLGWTNKSLTKWTYLASPD